MRLEILSIKDEGKLKIIIINEKSSYVLSLQYLQLTIRNIIHLFLLYFIPFLLYISSIIRSWGSLDQIMIEHRLHDLLNHDRGHHYQGAY